MGAPAQQSVFERQAPRYFTIAPGRSFLSDLATALRAAAPTGDPAALADMTIYLPTRRAVRALTQAFIDSAPDARASLLPQIRALGDIDEDELLVFDAGAADDPDLPPAISGSERRLALARLVAEKDKAFFDGQRDWAGAVAAADELGKLLDSLYTEEVPHERFETLAPDRLADHWRRNLEFLSIVTEAWPAYLEARGRMDPAARRIALIARQTAAWRRTPPATPVIVAGTTGSTPAVARMMKTVARLPMGCVVLPGLDRRAPPHVWDAIDEPHPQSGLKHLLEALETTREAVADWPLKEPAPAGAQARADLLTMALRPAGASDDWRSWTAAAKTDRRNLKTALHRVELVEAADEEFEAASIALKLREVIDTKTRTAMLVTPDRDLARRVSMKMRRWGVTVDDSGGVPFANSPCGTFLRLTASWLADIADPAALMAVLDHPLFGGGLDASARKHAAGELDLALRGLRPARGAEGLKRKLDGANLGEAARALFRRISALAQEKPAGEAPFAARFEAHLAISETLAASDTEDGADRLWRGDDGEAGAELLAQLKDGLDHIAQDAPSDYPAIFSRLIATASVRRRAPAHPRLFILGPLEARLQRADVIILGGLNEGVWPRDAAIDPFLSRPMRATLGLPSPERRIGLAAHDFMQLAAAADLMLTRALRAGGKPAKPSRWIVRLKNILKGAGALGDIDNSARYDALARRLDAPQVMKRIEAPQPTPPVDARPTSFYVTRIEKLMRDPYSIYARAVLRLKRLDRLNEPFGARHAGELFHKVLEDYARKEPPARPSDAAGALRALFETHAEYFGMTSEHRPFWDARADEALSWLAEWDRRRRALGAPAVIEKEGAWTFDIDGRAYTLSARADRIDRLDSAAAYIIDYKTGAPPTLKQHKTFSPQLPLTALIVAEGGFEALGAIPVDGFEYVRVVGAKSPTADNVGAQGEDCAGLMEKAREGLTALLRHFSDPATPYASQPRPQYVDAYGDYDHLARRRERNAQGSDM